MPIYEYRCGHCKRRVSIFWRTIRESETHPALCPRCGSNQLSRLVSRVATLRSEESRLDALADPTQLAGLDENDPRSLARWMRKMGDETGEDLGPEFHEVVNRLEAGENPDDIEKAMPDLGTPGTGSDFGTGVDDF